MSEMKREHEQGSVAAAISSLTSEAIAKAMSKSAALKDGSIPALDLSRALDWSRATTSLASDGDLFWRSLSPNVASTEKRYDSSRQPMPAPSFHPSGLDYLVSVDSLSREIRISMAHVPTDDLRLRLTCFPVNRINMDHLVLEYAAPVKGLPPGMQLYILIEPPRFIRTFRDLDDQTMNVAYTCKWMANLRSRSTTIQSFVEAAQVEAKRVASRVIEAMCNAAKGAVHRGGSMDKLSLEMHKAGGNVISAMFAGERATERVLRTTISHDVVTQQSPKEQIVKAPPIPTVQGQGDW